jgi:hypothetical protein
MKDERKIQSQKAKKLKTDRKKEKEQCNLDL